MQCNSTTRARTLTPKHSFGIFSVQVKWMANFHFVAFEFLLYTGYMLYS